jgi:hypothetical protein
MTCEECEEAYNEHGKDPPCEKCEKPVLMPENYDVIRIFNLCRAQLIISFDGVVGMSLPAVKTAMDMLGIEEQLSCAEKVMVYAEAVYSKKQEQPAPGSVEEE